MFEIGNSLREARLRQQLDFPEAERATKIRSKYLRALEDEEFDTLPAQTYVKGFLRTYAEFLGLDGQLYVDEYNSRFVVGEDESPFRPRRTSPRARQHRRVEASVVLIGVLAIGLVTALVIAAWKFAGGGSSGQEQAIFGQTPAAAPAAARPPHLLVSAVGGNSLLEVHAGSATGRLLFQGTLEQGESQRFGRGRLWINVSVPENLRFKLNGRLVRIGGASPRVLIVAGATIRAASAGAA